jgi:hypothetical protein
MATRELVVLAVVPSYIAQRALGMTVQRERGVLSRLVALNCAYVVFVYLCHPVGAHALGAAKLGIHGYFGVFTAWCAYWILVHMPESYTNVTKIPLWLTLGFTVSAAIAAIVYVFPPITPYVWFFYSGVDVSGYVESLSATTQGPEVRRLGMFGPFGVALITYLAAYFPLRTLANPLRWPSYLYLLGFIAVLASGFRNSFLLALLYPALAAWLRGNRRDVVVGAIIGLAFLGLLVSGQGRLFDLPLSAQRALGSLPGHWDEAVRREVKDSNARWDWWLQLIEERSFVSNWWTGDGFGLSQEDFNFIVAGRTTSGEGASMTGGFHSGPLTTIRYAGLVGLVLFYTMMIAGAVYSVKCVRRCRGTPLFPIAIFLAVQLVWEPIHFTLIFGAYDDELPAQLFLLGLLTLVFRMSQRAAPESTAVPTTRSIARHNGRTLVSS